MSDQEKRKINRNRDKIQELVNLKPSQTKRREILVQEGGAFLAPLLAPILGSLVGPLLKGMAGVQMGEGRKYVVVTPEVYEMLLIKAETPVNSIASTIKQIQENFNTVWNRVRISEEEKARLHTGELNKLRRAKYERNATAHPLQKASTDNVKEEKMNLETTFVQSLGMVRAAQIQIWNRALEQGWI